jgi:hypothetical protein
MARECAYKKEERGEGKIVGVGEREGESGGATFFQRRLPLLICRSCKR